MVQMEDIEDETERHSLLELEIRSSLLYNLPAVGLFP